MMKSPLHFFRPVVILCLLSALLRAAPDTPAPELALSLRGLVDDSLEQGEPLRVTVRLESSGNGTGTVELAPSAGTWADAVVVELSAAGGGAVLARANPVGVPASPRATLDRNRVAGGLWLFSPSSMQGLATGDYVVRARLSIKGGAGWSGEVVSDEVPLSVVAVSAAPERVSARTLGRAQIAFSTNAFEEAARLLDDVLTKTPDDFELLCLRADVSLRGGNSIAAMICVNRAARTLSPKAPGPPPLMLYEVQSRVFATPLAAPSSLATLPAWTWPPASVLSFSEKGATVQRDKAASMPGESPTAAVRVPAAAPLPTQGASLSSVTAPVPSAAAPGATPNRAVAPSIGTVVPSAELIDAKIIADPAGQWVASATAGSQYDKRQYSAAQATGAPNIPLGMAGNSPDAWCPEKKNDGTDWLEVAFAQPVHAREVRVRQNNAPGAIAKIEAIESDGTPHVWWEGVDPAKRSEVREIVWFAVRVPPTAYLVAKVKITLNLAAVPDWKEIDAVQLVGTAP